MSDYDQQTFLQAMFKEHRDQVRQHETLRQQSTTLIFALAGTIATAGGAAISLTTSPLITSGLYWIFFFYSPLGIFVTGLAWFGRNLSLKHYERNRYHAEYARAYRKRLESLFPLTVSTPSDVSAPSSVSDLRREAQARHYEKWLKENVSAQSENGPEISTPTPDQNLTFLRKKERGRREVIYESSTFRYWGNLYFFLMGLGVVLTIIPIIFALYPFWRNLRIVQNLTDLAT